MKRIFITFVIGLSAAAALAQDPSSRPSSREVASSGERLLPDVNFDHVSIDDAIEFLRQTSGENIVIRRTEGAQTPQIESVRLKNVTVEQALAAIDATTPGITVENAKGVLVVEIHKLADDAGQSTVAVYNLSHLGGTATAQPFQHLKDVLSLIDTALKATDGPQPTVQFHEPTQTLIVKGTSAQHSAVDQILASQAPVETTPPGNLFGPGSVDNVPIGSLSDPQLAQMEHSLQEELSKVHALRQAFAHPATQP